ncbi:serine/threonine protein kinase [Saccharopolyspora sp. K220]|uniref:serine/threonine protein kinase n=1 Tax=Saccharopolyspora soli TaxID=2926618 RepID=UPI001F584C28|nr:serine/threonine-protein kinase [Saccharopolyspora soli]MCI2416057.1 serine/threonine protein kinase [Saccharopolyspora soli]
MEGSTDPAFPSQHEVADLLPEYELAPLPLSQTNMSQVYPAVEPRLYNRRVAVKVMDRNLAEDTRFRERFLREVRVLSTLSHPNIVEVYTASTPNADLLYLVMPFADHDLQRLLNDGPLDLSTTVHIIGQVAAALDYALDHGVVHRDVKPGNILLTGAARHVYLCDFGIAKELSGENLTKAGEFYGTVHYAPPERLSEADSDDPALDRRGEVYSLGALLYHCLTGQRPFDFADMSAVVAAQQRGDLPRVSELRDGLPEALDHVVRKALDPKPTKRYASCTELAEALAAAVATQGTRLSWADQVQQRLTRIWRTNRRLVVSAAAAALVVVLTAVIVPQLGTDVGDEPSDDLLARIPAGLRASCQIADPATGAPAASDVVSCSDGSQQVTFSLFDQLPDMDRSYADALNRAEVSRGSGDCTVAAGAEHRYPGAGPTLGRVLCYSRDGSTSVVWTDNAARTVARASRRDIDDVGLASSWATWVGLPSFPTAEEKSLIDLVGLENCRRAPSGGLESFRNVLAAIDCPSPDDGANTISYYRFADLDGLQHTYNSHVNEVGAPSEVYCGDGAARGFLGNNRLDLRSIEIGGLLCYRGPQDTPVIEWTIEPLLLMTRGTGAEPEALASWWRQYYGFEPFAGQVIEAINANAKPAFPTPQEQALLNRIPEASRVDCMRPPQQQIELNVQDQPVAAVVCGPTRGAGIVFYYQLPDTASMNSSYEWNTDITGPDCNTGPPDFRGNAPYARNGTTGRLSCAMNDTGNPFLIWTDDQQKILTFAFKGSDPPVLLDWWRSQAGPIPG